MANEFVAPSGAKVVINLAPWSEAKMLKAAMLDAAAKAGITVDLEADLTSLVRAVLMIDSSGTVDFALWPCLMHCTRKDERIIESMFDTEDGRKDYYPIVIACVEANFRPLVESLLSKLPKGLQEKIKAGTGSPK